MTSLLKRVTLWRFVAQAQIVTAVAFAGSTILAWQGFLVVPWWILLVGVILPIVAWQYAEHQTTKLLNDASVQAQFQARQAFDALYERSPVAYVLLDADGAVRLANTAAVHLLGTTIDNISASNFYDFIANTGEVTTSVLKSKIEKGITITEAEMPLRTAVGTEKWALVSVFLPSDKTQRLIALVDITDQKAVDTAKSEFVALATHQLRTPIAAIRWNVELLSKSLTGNTTEKQDKYLTKVERNVRRMLSLINDFLSVSKLEMGTFAAASEEVKLAEYLDEILQEFDEKITQKQLQFKKRADPTDIVIKTDSRLLHIIFSNLISNAVKYTPEHGTVQIEAIATGGSLSLTIADTGMGVPESEVSQLFTKFYRASNAQQQVTEGTGLGLYVVKQSVEILGGTIDVQSVEDEGTTFVVQLPSVVVSGE